MIESDYQAFKDKQIAEIDDAVALLSSSIRSQLKRVYLNGWSDAQEALLKEARMLCELSGQKIKLPLNATLPEASFTPDLYIDELLKAPRTTK